MAFDIVGVDSNYKVPLFAGQVVFGQGPLQGPGTRRLLLQGLKTSAGTLTLDGAPQMISGLDDAATKAGVGSLLYRQAKAAIAWGLPIEIWLAAVTPASGGVASTWTLAISGSWSTSGQWALTIANTVLTGGTTSSDTNDTIGAAIAAAINANTELPFTAAYVAGSTHLLTATCKNVGVSGNDWLIYSEASGLASGMVITLTGSASQGTNRIFSGATLGSGTEDVTTSLTQLTDKWYSRISTSSNDATNIALWKTQLNTLAGPTILLLEQLVIGYNGTYSTAQTRAQTTMNEYRAQAVWFRYCESHPAEIAAAWAALRTATEGDTWVPDYDGKAFPMLAPQRYPSDVPTAVELNTALNNGVTPMTTVNSAAQSVRAIVTHCLTGSQPDYRCLDVGDAVVPDNVLYDQQSLYAGFRQSNTLVGPNPAAGQPTPPSGVAYPDLWTSVQAAALQGYYASGWTQDDGTLYPPLNSYNATAGRIQGALTVVPRRLQHQILCSVRQQAA